MNTATAPALASLSLTDEQHASIVGLSKSDAKDRLLGYADHFIESFAEEADKFVTEVTRAEQEGFIRTAESALARMTRSIEEAKARIRDTFSEGGAR